MATWRWRRACSGSCSAIWHRFSQSSAYYKAQIIRLRLYAENGRRGVAGLYLRFQYTSTVSLLQFRKILVSAVPAWFRVYFRLVQDNPPILRSRCFATPFLCVAGSQFISLQNKHMIHIFIIEERPAGDMFLVSWVICPWLRG